MINYSSQYLVDVLHTEPFCFYQSLDRNRYCHHLYCEHTYDNTRQTARGCIKLKVNEVDYLIFMNEVDYLIFMNNAIIVTTDQSEYK